MTSRPPLKLVEGGLTQGPQGLQSPNTQRSSEAVLTGFTYSAPTYYRTTFDIRKTFDVDLTIQEPQRPERSVTAQLPTLPAPLRPLHGPILVTLHYWRDSVEADLPICALTGEAETDTAALEDLGEVMLAWAQGIVEDGTSNLAGSLLRQWNAFIALVDVSGL